MTSGVELLLRGVMPDADVALVFGHGGSSDADEAERAALVSDTKNAAQEWRSGSFFAPVPSPGASVEELATWMRQ